MGYQIIKQPGGRLAIRSSETDHIVVWDATRDEVLQFFIELAVADTIRRTGRLADLVLADEPRKAYYQFAMTWDEAVAEDREHGGQYTDTPQ